MRKYFKLIALCILLTGCKLGPDYKIPQLSFPDGWGSEKTKVISTEPIDESWWGVFQEPLLDKLITQATDNNHDIRIATANIAKARALRRETAGGFWPSLEGAATGAKQGLSNKTTANSNSSGAKERDVFNSGLDASWELDIFGKSRRDIESAEADLQAAEESRSGVLLSIFSEVARNYFELRGLQKRVAVAEHNIELVREIEELAQTQFDLGVVTEFDVARARGEREAIEATLPGLQADMTATIYRISVLTGQSPETYIKELNSYKPLPAPPDIVPVGLRSDILRRRPDVREAERNLASATAKIGVATADLFPSLSLTGALGSSAALFSDLFTQGAITYSLGSTINWSLFEGGALRARIAAAEAGADIALINYEKTALEALEDAETSLTRYGKEWQTLNRLRAAEKTRREAFDIAKLRYEAGEENFLVIIDAERALVSAQDSVIQSETRMLTSLTQLYKALGGGWQTVSFKK